MNKVKEHYEQLCSEYGDINEHLPTLCRYAMECDSIFETGIRGCVSSWALAYGLLNGIRQNQTEKRMLLNDKIECDIDEFVKAMSMENIKISWIWENNLTLDLEESFDLTFIDTWHVYGQLKRELEKFSKITKKYIIMHDTTVDEWEGETLRLHFDAVQQSIDSGIPIDEINKGLWPAIDEFLKKNPEWMIKERFSNNNGLTILSKTSLIKDTTGWDPHDSRLEEENEDIAAGKGDRGVWSEHHLK